MTVQTTAPKTTTPRTRKAAAPAKPSTNPVSEVAIPDTREAAGYTVDLKAPGEDNESRNYEKLMEKPPSDLHQDFVDFVKENTDYTADPKTVQLVLALYAEYQRSPKSKERTQARRAAAAIKKAQREAATLKRLREQAAKLAKLEAAAKESKKDEAAPAAV